jgi:hypothetical protein
MSVSHESVHSTTPTPHKGPSGPTAQLCRHTHNTDTNIHATHTRTSHAVRCTCEQTHPKSEQCVHQPHSKTEPSAATASPRLVANTHMRCSTRAAAFMCPAWTAHAYASAHVHAHTSTSMVWLSRRLGIHALLRSHAEALDRIGAPHLALRRRRRRWSHTTRQTCSTQGARLSVAWRAHDTRERRQSVWLASKQCS